MWGTAEKHNHFPVWLEAVRKCFMMYCIHLLWPVCL